MMFRAWKTLPTWFSMVLLIPLSIFKRMLEQIDGTISSEMSMNGMMSIKTTTTLKLNGL